MKRQSVVLLHGWGLSGRTFEPLTTELKRRGHRVFTPDFPGFGEVELPTRALNLSDYVEFLHGYLKENGIVQPVLIGHSFGGRVALKYQLLYPKNVRVLILSGTPGFTPVGRKKLTLFIFLAKIGKAFFFLPPLNILQDPIRRWYYYLVGARDFYRAEGVMRDTFKRIVQEDLLACMKAVRVPCLLIWGAWDTIVPVAIARQMSDVIPGAKVEVIENSNHGVPYNNPNIFADRVITFLRSL